MVSVALATARELPTAGTISSATDVSVEINSFFFSFFHFSVCFFLRDFPPVDSMILQSKGEIHPSLRKASKRTRIPIPLPSPTVSSGAMAQVWELHSSVLAYASFSSLELKPQIDLVCTRIRVDRFPMCPPTKKSKG